MKKILIVNPFYFPGWRSGGPQQTIMNVVDVLGTEADFYILTHNHDMGVDEPYPNIKYDSWVKVGNAKVYYGSTEHFSLDFLGEMANQFELIYICGPYYEESYKLLWLKRIGKLKSKTVLAPMGSFSEGALSHKSKKKWVFWTAFRALGLFKNISWSFTSEMERNEATACIGKKSIAEYYIAEDLPKKYVDFSMQKKQEKVPGKLKIVFLSRICPQKNLLQAISIVSKLKGTIQFDIYGTKEDKEYWERCEKTLHTMPSNIKWRYCDAVPSNQVIPTFLEYDIFLLPTLGENFGHVIYEALVAGCIPVISNRTPWAELRECSCGYTIPLENETAYVQCIQNFVDMDKEYIAKHSLNAMKYAEKKYSESVRTSGYYKIIK